VSEGIGEARPEAEGELALARLALDDGELPHAAEHVANAIGRDPTLRAAYATLDELADAVADALALVPVDGTPHAGTVAARSYLMARAGQLDGAFHLLCRVAEAQPDQPWSAGWLAAPGADSRDLGRRLNPGHAGTSVMRLALGLPTPVPGDTVQVLTPFLEAARGVADRGADAVTALPSLSGLARRMGALDEAIEWCERAEQADGSAFAAIMLGYALRNAGRKQDAHEAWQRALRRDPGNVNLRVDIAELLADRGELVKGIGVLDQALAMAPDHPKAFPSSCEMRFALTSDVAHLVRLADWWREHPEHGYAGTMLGRASQGKWWLSLVPAPAEAICNLAVAVAEQRGDLNATMSCALSALEPPSAIAAVRAAMPGMTLASPVPVPAPDIRVPVAKGRHVLWRYDGTSAVPVAAVPSARAVRALQAVAAQGVWHHPVAAYDWAVGLSGLSVDDLLGLIAHGVPVPDDNLPWQRMRAENPVYWPRFAQAWACLGVLHHKPDEPWPDSARRAVLVDLVNGVEDWATDAAANALVVAAWTDPACRDDVAEIIGVRFAAAGQARLRRQVTIAESLARLVLITPGVPRTAVSAANALIRHETARVKAIKDEKAAAPPGQPPAPGQPPTGSRPRRRLFRPRP
jgi:tetratricopeptide (TPR) repeat protein